MVIAGRGAKSIGCRLRLHIDSAAAKCQAQAPKMMTGVKIIKPPEGSTKPKIQARARWQHPFFRIAYVRNWFCRMQVGSNDSRRTVDELIMWTHINGRIAGMSCIMFHLPCLRLSQTAAALRAERLLLGTTEATNWTKETKSTNLVGHFWSDAPITSACLTADIIDH